MTKIWKSLIGLILLLSLSLGVHVYATKEYMYEDLLVDRLGIVWEDEDGTRSYWYEERFYYYSDDNRGTPDYVLIRASEPAVSDESHSSDFGEYVIVSGGIFYPYDHAYYIYVPADDMVYTLEEAYYANIAGLEEALRFLNGKEVALIGDADGDFMLTIKDATLIQKHLANISDTSSRHELFELMFEAQDFNRDKKVNIRDVTAIQKRIAGIE